MNQPFPSYKTAPVDSLVPYARNSRTHSADQIRKIAASIKEFGFLNPVIVDGANGIIAGHGRVLAAKQIGMTEVPVVEAGHLTEAQRRAYVIADNRLALDAGWDDAILKMEMGDLQGMGFDIGLTGFDLGEIGEIMAGPKPDDFYTRKIDAPIYEITGENPAVETLMDQTKAKRLRADIARADIPDDVKAFLNAAADRHTVFEFARIAEFYAHASPEVQALMEDSALVIIDFNKAIEQGFVKLSSRLYDLMEANRE